jgi:hypothetical protein
LVALTDPHLFPFQAIAAPVLTYEIDWNYPDQSYIRWCGDRRVYTYDATTRVITLVSTTREYYSGWLNFGHESGVEEGQNSGWFVRGASGGPHYWYTLSSPSGEGAASSTRTTAIYANMQRFVWNDGLQTWDAQYDDEVLQESGITETLSAENTEANVLGILNTLLGGPWEDVDTETADIDWDNQTYFDSELAHSGYYHVYYDPGTDDGLLKQVVLISGFSFISSPTKKHLWVGYTIDYPPSEGWPAPASHIDNTPNPLLTRTRCRLRSSDAEIKLNRSNLRFDQMETLSDVIPFSDVATDNDGAEYVYTGDETDANDLFNVCDTYTEIGAPSHVGNQAWHHIYL